MEIFLFFLSPVKPPKRDHILDWMFGPCIEVVLSRMFSFKFIVGHYKPHNDSIKIIMLQ